MKSVLISIQPYWVFLIIAEIMGWNIGKQKTVEVRKNYPKDENWDNVAKIYCSKDKRSFAKIPKEYQPLMDRFLGKVIGEFLCDKIETIEIRHFTVFGHENRYAAVGDNPDNQWLAHSCLKYDEVAHYGKCAPLFGWHISNLVIYDNPKKLDEFCIEDKSPCDNRERVYQNPDYNPTGGLIYGGNYCRKTHDWCKRCKVKRLNRPPQSWGYVEGEI